MILRPRRTYHDSPRLGYTLIRKGPVLTKVLTKHNQRATIAPAWILLSTGNYTKSERLQLQRQVRKRSLKIPAETTISVSMQIRTGKILIHSQANYGNWMADNYYCSIATFHNLKYIILKSNAVRVTDTENARNDLTSAHCYNNINAPRLKSSVGVRFSFFRPLRP